MQGLYRRDLAMSGSAVNGNTRVEIIAGVKDPGNMPEKVIPGNQDIGKIAKATGGIRVAGINNIPATC